MPTEVGLTTGIAYEVHESTDAVGDAVAEAQQSGDWFMLHLYSKDGSAWDLRPMAFRASAVITIVHSEDDD